MEIVWLLTNKCVLIKGAPKVNSGSITNATNFATPKIHFISHVARHNYFSYKSIVIFILNTRYKILEGGNLGELQEIIRKNFLVQIFLPKSSRYIASMLNSAMKLNNMLSF